MDSDKKTDRTTANSSFGDTLSDSEIRFQKIQKKINSAQSNSDFAEFGFVKIWIALVEFLSVFYARTQERKANIEYVTIKEKNKLKKQEKK